MSQSLKVWDGAHVQKLPGYVDAAPILGQQEGRWYRGGGGTSNTVAMVLDRLYFAPVVVSRRRIIAELGMIAIVAGATGSVSRFAVYSDIEGVPGALLIDAGTVSSAATGNTTKPVGLVVEAGMYWVAVIAQGGVAPPTVRRLDGGDSRVGVRNIANVASNGYYIDVSGALPATAGMTIDSAVTPVLYTKL